MSKFAVSAIVWAGCWFGSFLVFELSAIFWKGCPWFTLSSTVWHIEALSKVLVWLVLVGMAVLLVHFVTGFPGKG